MMQTVYIVDDDDSVREAAELLLDICGFKVKAYADGASFVADCDESYSGCVLLDMAMPGLDGPCVLAQLKANGIHLPVIFFSGHGDTDQALQAGAVGLLHKPPHKDELLTCVRKALALDLEHREQGLK